MIWHDYRKLYQNALVKYSPKFKKELQRQVDTYCDTQDLNAISDKAIKRTIQELHMALGTKMAIISEKSVKSAVKGLKIESKSVKTDLFSYVILKVLENDGLSTLAQNITETTKNQINQYVQRSMAEGLSIQETIKLLRGAGITDYRAELIARTETGRAANLGSQIGAINTGLVTVKEWISAKDARTRRIPLDHTDHLHMDGVKIPMQEQFKVPNNKSGLGYDLMDHPCDSKAPASQVCNCRCTMGYEAQRGADGKLLTYNTNPPFGRIGFIWNLLQNVIGMQIGNLIAEALTD